MTIASMLFRNTARATATGAVLATMIPAAALAGGYTTPAPAPEVLATVEAAPASRWEGSYVGGALSYAGNGDDRVGLWDSSDTLQQSVGTLDNSGAMARAYVGHRWQRDSGLVFGTQIGILGGNVEDSVTSGTTTASTELKHAIQLRGHVGTEIAENTLAYVHSGIAYGKFDVSLDQAGASSSASYSRVGYTAGVGIERAFDENLSVYGEYEYANFGKERVDLGSVHTFSTPEWHSLSVGVNYRF